MIGWVEKDDDVTRLTIYNSRIKTIAALAEIDGEWLVIDVDNHLDPTIHTMIGRDCPDPVEFLMTLISPRNTEDPGGPLVVFDRFDTSERWEIWEVR